LPSRSWNYGILLPAKLGESRLEHCEHNASSAPSKATHKGQRRRSAGKWANIQHLQLFSEAEIKRFLELRFTFELKFKIALKTRTE